jgi:hypothetical protein
VRQKSRHSGGSEQGGRSREKGKRKATTDFAEEEVPVSCGGSSSSAPEFETTKKVCFDLLMDKTNNLESKKLGLAEEEAKFYERYPGLQDTYAKLLEWSDAEKAKKIEVLEKKYQDVLALNRKEYKEAQQEVDEPQKAHFTCLGHYLDSWYLCGGKFMENLQEPPIDCTKLLRKWGYKIKHFV